MKTLMIDMDNVITDGNFNKYIEEFMNIKVDFNELTEYKYVQDLVKNKKNEFWNYVKDKDFYKDSELLDGCYEVLKRLNNKYDIYIVTSYLWNDFIDLSGKNLNYKYDYLKEKLPFIEPEKYVFTTNKSLLKFDIKLDDKMSNLDNSDIKLLFSRWHNKNITNDLLENEHIIRVNNWYDIEKLLCDEV